MQSHHHLPCLRQTWRTRDFLPLCSSLLCIQQLLFSTQSPLLWVNTHPSIFSRLLTDLTALLSPPSSWAQLSGHTVPQPPLATLAKALLMQNQAEGWLHVTFSPVSQFVHCGVCLFHDISDSCLACDPWMGPHKCFFFLLQSCYHLTCCSSLHTCAADCSCMASEPCTLQFLCKTSSTVCSVFTIWILSLNMPAVPPTQGCVEI